jgi:hypothetical protein
MTNRKATWRLWGEKFKAFRLRAGFASQNELADALSHLILTSGNNLILSVSQISRWENGQRCPFRREQHLTLIEGLVRLGGIQTPEEAHAWLQAGNQGGLSAEERGLLFADMRAADRTPQTASRGVMPHTAVPLVGRSEEWRQLRSIWQAAQRGGSRLVVIQGEPGIGKTRLAEELMELAHRQGYSAL